MSTANPKAARGKLPPSEFEPLRPFDSLSAPDRKEIIDCFDGEEGLAASTWGYLALATKGQTIRGVELQSTRPQRTNERYGKALKAHMNDVKKTSVKLRRLLDLDTMAKLFFAPLRGTETPLSRLKQHRRGLLKIKEALAEIERQVDAEQWETVIQKGPFRMDFMLVLVMKRGPDPLAQGSKLGRAEKRLLEIAFAHLGIATDVKDAIKGAGRIRF